MITLGFFTDLHLRGPRQTPVWRTGSFEEDMLNKLEAMRDKFEDQVDLWIFGGDFVHGPSVSVRSVNKAVDILSGLPLVGAFGQHDTYGHDPKQVEASTASIVQREFPQGFDHRSAVWRTKKQGLTIEVINHHDQSLEYMRGGNIGKDPHNTPDIVVAHTMVADVNVQWDHIKPDEIKTDGTVRVIFTGDYHTGFEPALTTQKALVVNPGAISRNTITEATREPKIALVEIHEDGGIEYSYETVPHRPAEEAFDLDGFEDVQEKSEKRGEYARRLEEMDITGAEAWEKLFETIDDNDIDPNIKKEAYERCQKQAETKN